MKNKIELKIPKKPDYFSIARLTSAGVGHNIGLNIDEIEDVKVCIGEACIMSLTDQLEDYINISFKEEDKKLHIYVDNIVEENLDREELKLGLLIIKSLMDEVEFCESSLKMTKYIEDGSQ